MGREEQRVEMGKEEKEKKNSNHQCEHKIKFFFFLPLSYNAHLSLDVHCS